MGDIQFNDGTSEFGAPPTRGTAGGTDLTGKLVTWGLAKDRQQAQMIMAAVAVVALLGAGYLAFFTGGTDVPTAPVFN